MQELRYNSLKENWSIIKKGMLLSFKLGTNAWHACLAYQGWTCLPVSPSIPHCLPITGLGFHIPPLISPTRRLQCQSPRSTSLYNPEILLNLPIWTFGLLTAVAISSLSHLSSPFFLPTRASSDWSCLLQTLPYICSSDYALPYYYNQLCPPT